MDFENLLKVLMLDFEIMDWLNESRKFRADRNTERMIQNKIQIYPVTQWIENAFKIHLLKKCYGRLYSFAKFLTFCEAKKMIITTFGKP